MMTEEYVRITVADSAVTGQCPQDLSDVVDVVYETDKYKAAADAEAVIFTTDWSRHPALDWQRLYDSMRRLALVFDTRHCLDVTASS